MQYDVKTPEEYMKAIDDDWRRETLMDLRQVIKNYGIWVSVGAACESGS